MPKLQISLHAYIIGGDGVVYYKRLAPHFFNVAIWNIFPPFNETDAARKHWGTVRIYKQGDSLEQDGNSPPEHPTVRKDV